MSLWRRSRKAAAAVAEEMVEFTAECDEADAEPVLAEVPSIVIAPASVQTLCDAPPAAVNASCCGAND